MADKKMDNRVKIIANNVKNLLWLQYERGNWYNEISFDEARNRLENLFLTETDIIMLGDDGKSIIKEIIDDTLKSLRESSNKYNYNLLNHCLTDIIRKRGLDEPRR